MKMDNTQRVPASQATVWAALNESKTILQQVHFRAASGST
jgi:hypothetical protein